MQRGDNFAAGPHVLRSGSRLLCCLRKPVPLLPNPKGFLQKGCVYAHHMATDDKKRPHRLPPPAVPLRVPRCPDPAARLGRIAEEPFRLGALALTWRGGADGLVFVWEVKGTGHKR